MNKSANLIMALGMCVLCARSAPAQRVPEPNQPQNSGVQMTLTHLSVTDQTLDLSWKIMNNTNHDVWICNGYEQSGGSICYFNRLMDEDNKTLVLRRRYNRRLVGWLERGAVPRNFRYLRLRPGQEKVESHSFTLPVTPLSIFDLSPGRAESAQRLAIEIGFYDEDLRALILDVVDMAERIGYDDSALSAAIRAAPPTFYDRFFGGFGIAVAFKNTGAYFHDSVMSDSDEILAPAMQQTLNGEQTLRIDVDDVSIPYNSGYPPLVAPEAPSGVTTVLTNLDVNDTNLTLGLKIRNNTDHDVWVCNGYDRDSSIRYFERFMATDDKTLVLRRRYNLLRAPIVERFPGPFHYLRLRPGQEKIESHSFALPVTSTSPLFEGSSGGLNANSAQRLAIEIGFYDEDLRALILDVVQIAESLHCDDSAIRNVQLGTFAWLFHRFFGGFRIAQSFKTENITYFRDSVTSDGDEILAPPMHQTLNGEQVLPLEVESLSIPFSLF